MTEDSIPTSHIKSLPFPWNRGFSDAMFAYCIRELRDKARITSETGITSVFESSAAAFKSDVLVDESLRLRLVEQAKKLEDVPEAEKDWHPGSDNRVLDLVHPSLFPLVYGRTRGFSDRVIVSPEAALDLIGAGEVIGEKYAPTRDEYRAMILKTFHPDATPNPEVARQSVEERLDRIMAGEEVLKEAHRTHLSRQFQWLPAEVKISDDGSKVLWTSYINNLHPVQHADLYDTLGEILRRVLPMLDAAYQRVMSWDWETDPRKRINCMRTVRHCTTPVLCKKKGWCDMSNMPRGWRNGRRGSVSDQDEEDHLSSDSDADEQDYYETADKSERDADAADAAAAKGDEGESSSEYGSAEEGGAEGSDAEADAEDAFDSAEEGNDDDDDDDDGSDEDDIWETREAWYAETHPVQYPNPTLHSYTYPGIETYHRSEPLNTRRLQVIVKLANIHLTPEDPVYPGGGWHLEGLHNERIVLTALYYYDVSNITESKLSLRTNGNGEGDEGMTCEFQYEQNDHAGAQEYFDIDTDWDAGSIMDHGSLTARQGRVLVFPNTYQHKVEPFELADKSRPGHRKILAFFVVDPKTPVISTRNVPPQQAHWAGSRGLLEGKLPEELVRQVMKDVECPYDLETAKEIRLGFMKERSRDQEETNERMRSVGGWSFCEH